MRNLYFSGVYVCVFRLQSTRYYHLSLCRSFSFHKKNMCNFVVKLL